MKRTTRFLALFLSLLFTVLAVSCAPRPMAASAGTPEPPPPTAAPTATPEPTPEPTETPEPTPIVDEFDFTEERKAELNQQIQDFLSYEGEYSKENIQKYLLPGVKKDEFYNLGLVKANESIIETQSWLFDYVEKDGDLLLIVGFDGKDGQRLVTILNIPIHIMKMSSVIQGISLVKLNGWNR